MVLTEKSKLFKFSIAFSQLSRVIFVVVYMVLKKIWDKLLDKIPELYGTEMKQSKFQ